MDSMDNLSLFFDAYHTTNRYLQLVVPSLNESITISSLSHQTRQNDNSVEEVYAGLPTIYNAQSLFQALSRCPPPAGFLTSDKISKLTARQFLYRLELVAILASVYELHSTESAAWQAVEVFSHRTKRVIDEVYGFANRAFLDLRIAEQRCFANREAMARKVSRIHSAIKSKSTLRADYEYLVAKVKLPTAHANLQCVVVDALFAYLECYGDFCAIVARLDIVLMRHKDFLDSKVWAAIYSRAFINWLTLRARLTTGGPVMPTMEEDTETPPVSSVFMAMNVKAHGQTLVKYIMSQMKPKVDKCNENKENRAPSESALSNWLAESAAPVSDMLNLWLGYRLLLYGTIQVAELYTLLGTVKEARVYQLELLRLSQRFHIPSCAQAAICMMAHTDLLSHREWAFDLRLNQLNHILNSRISLGDIIKSREGNSTESGGIGDEVNRLANDGDDHADAGQEGEAAACSGTATNSAADAVVGVCKAIYPTSALKGTSVMDSSSGYPSVHSMVKVISQGCGYKGVESEGAFTSTACAHRILNGCLWVWLGEVSDLIRTKVTSRDHFLSALVPPDWKSYECKCTLQSAVTPVAYVRPMTRAAQRAQPASASLSHSLRTTSKCCPPRGYSTPAPSSSTSCSRCNPRESLVKAQNALADCLYSAYSRLAALPVPHLLRPVCQWLGLRWLGRENHAQAARFFGQATGIVACELFTSILCSKLKFEGIAGPLRSIYAMSASNDSSGYLKTRAVAMPPINVIQLMLVDELGHLEASDTCDSFEDVNDYGGTQPAKYLVAGGLGSRRYAHLVATRWILDDTESAFESRVMHKFFSTGMSYIKDFSDLQTQNEESVLEEDRRRFWELRYSLDSRLKNLIDEVRNAWFTAEELLWIKDSSNPKAYCERSFILVLDRQLTLLPWEWIIWGEPFGDEWDDEKEANCCVPAVCRNFSVNLVIGHLKLTKCNVARFDPDSAFYVVTPEANLPHTESIFRDYFGQKFPKWSGILGRFPQTEEVVRGFTQKDLFVYLGHGNGSKFLMSALNESQNAKAVAFIIGCSSGRPRLEGRHEAYASIFNHLITGAPTAVSLLWDVTDKDIDRFTQTFIDKWILLKDDNNATPLSMTCKIFKATKACKLQSLVGKSVIVYGIPAIPTRPQE